MINKPYKRKADNGMMKKPSSAQIRLANNCATPWRDAGTHPLLDIPAASVPPHECRETRRTIHDRVTGERLTRIWRT